MPGDYKELLAWQRSMDLIVTVYESTRHFPADERFGLTNQLRRAVVSIASNIAEGQGRQTNADFQRFLRIANGSRQEVETQFLVATRLGFVDEHVTQPILERLQEIGRLIGGLIRSLS
ncbi:MAG TPA: four helix bundle protein [Tepidisphaeraceae bacterium]|jgi:four helix bundle protein